MGRKQVIGTQSNAPVRIYLIRHSETPDHPVVVQFEVLRLATRFKKMTRVTSFKGVIEPLWCAAISAGSVEKRSAL